MTALTPQQLRGRVVSDKMQKTVVVAVRRLVWHPKYKKQYKVTTRFKAHAEPGQCQTGDQVMIQASRPLSKEKRWRVVNKI